uniref:Ig-like domain-containing protein n=1 Tax=Accipiter nisus TaxID=211598 RepID=A0A8B9LX68_9AVES
MPLSQSFTWAGLFPLNLVPAAPAALLTLHQPQSVLVVEPGASVEIGCKADKDPESKSALSWYRRSKDGPDLLLDGESGTKGRFSCTYRRNNLTLHIASAQPNDTSLYLCACFHINYWVFGSGTTLLVGGRTAASPRWPPCSGDGLAPGWGDGGGCWGSGGVTTNGGTSQPLSPRRLHDPWHLGPGRGWGAAAAQPLPQHPPPPSPHGVACHHVPRCPPVSCPSHCDLSTPMPFHPRPPSIIPHLAPSTSFPLGPLHPHAGYTSPCSVPSRPPAQHPDATSVTGG